MRIAKWGNSLAVRIPKKVVEKLDLKEGDEVNLGFSEGATPYFEISRAEAIEAGLKAMRQRRGMMPTDFKFNRDEANER